MKYLILFNFSALLCKSQEIDYCAKSLCPYQGQHVRCQNDGSFSSACVGEYKLIDLEPHRNLILQEHNFYRNMIASGNLSCFKPATRMPELYWNNELAETAAYNVKTCVFAHDKCRSTVKHPYAGQNIYYAKTNRQNVSIAEFITEAIFLWFNEQKDCDFTVLESFRKTNPQTGHFCLLVNDRNTFVGCSLLISIMKSGWGRKSNRTMILFTCNYTSTNIRNKPSYKPGPTASDCRALSERYPALCVDRINPNDIDWYDYHKL